MNAGSTERLVTKTFVNEDGIALIVCPACGETKEISVNDLPKRKPQIRVRCKCSNTFTVVLETRMSYRKETDLPGRYWITFQGNSSGEARIRNISFRGFCFEVAGRHTITAGQRGVVDFTLDDRNNTRIRKEFYVKGVDGSSIRCRFNQDKAYEKDLGFYLRAGL